MRGASAVLVAALSVAVVSAINLHVIHTNDVHSQYTPVTVYKKPGDYGGSARMATKVAALRAVHAGEPVLVVDGGDQSQGSLLYFAWKEQVVAWNLGVVGYDAVTLGNHEFDSGSASLTRLLAALRAANRTDVVCANVNVTADPAFVNVSAVVRRYKKYIFGDLTVAVTGLLSPETRTLSSPSALVQFADPQVALNEVLTAIEADGGADAVIVLSHLGYDADKALAAATSGVSMIVGGHSHTMLWPTNNASLLYPYEGPYPTVVKNANSKDALVVQAASMSCYVGEMTLVVAKGGDRAPSGWNGQLHVLGSTVVSDSNVVSNLTKVFLPKVDQFNKTVLGTTKTALDGERLRVRFMETTYGNVAADAVAEIVGAEVAILNGGSLRNSIDIGTVTAAKVLNSFPFADYLYTLWVKGSVLWAALTHGTKLVALPASTSGNGRFPQVSGLRYIYDPALPDIERIMTVKFCRGNNVSACAPLDNATQYKLVVSGFLLNGGDGYSMFRGIAANESQYTSYDAMKAYFAKHTPISPKIEGRILVCASGSTDHDNNVATRCLPCPAVPASDVPAGSKGPCHYHDPNSALSLSTPFLLLSALLSLFVVS